jgi:hypothetical protein
MRFGHYRTDVVVHVGTPSATYDVATALVVATAMPSAQVRSAYLASRVGRSKYQSLREVTTI